MRRAVVQTVVGLVVASLGLAACGHHQTGSGNLAQPATVDVTAPATAPGPSGYTPAAGTHGGNGGNGGGGGGGGGGGTPVASGSSAPGSGSPDAAPPGKGKPTKLKIPGNYSVTVRNTCTWMWSTDGVVRVEATYRFTHTGLLPASKLTYSVTEDAEHTTTASYVAGDWLKPSYSIDVAAGEPGHDDFAGDRVTMTVTINPGGVDDNASDNKAVVTMYVPTGPVPSGANTFTTIPCVVDYGETTS
jgi:hypothetical protein